MVEPDLCRAVRGRKLDRGCEVDSSNAIFKHCTAVGGKLENGGKCVISEEKLRQLIK